MNQKQEIDEIFVSVAKELNAAMISVRCLLIHFDEAISALEKIREVREYTADFKTKKEAFDRGEIWED